MIDIELARQIKQDALKEWSTFYHDFDHDTEMETVPYGDTYVSLGVTPTEESIERCKRAFHDEFNLDDFYEETKRNYGIEITDEIKSFIISILEKI